MENQNIYDHQGQPMGQMMPPARTKLKVRDVSRNGYAIPAWIGKYAVVAYVLALLAISLMYSSYAMQWYWWIFGIVGVAGFFLGMNHFMKKWGGYKEQIFKKRVFWSAFGIRAMVVLILYAFFNYMTGKPFMFSSADEQFYHEMGEWLSRSLSNSDLKNYLEFSKENVGFSDSGYPTYVGIVYFLTGNSIIALRIVNSILSALTCVLLYKLGKRSMGEMTGRLVAIFMMLEPHYLIYCGLHLKETVMIFLVVLFLERADDLLRSRNFKILEIIPIFLIIAIVFTFRTVLGVTLALSVILTLILSSKKVASFGRRWLLLILFIFGAGIFVGDRITSEIQYLWDQKENNQASRMSVIQKTQSLAKYASQAVFAPMIFTIPFPTMVETEGQENHRLFHSGCVVKNVMSFFCIIAIVALLLNPDPKTGWRNNVLLGAYLIIYLLILIQSAFVHADRFHMPAYVIELLFAAYGVTLITKSKHKRWYMYWCVLMFVAWIGWSWFKLKGRGL